MARAMMEEARDEFYYVTAMNENYAQPSMPEGVEEDIIKGLYRVEARAPQESSARVRLLGSGAIFPQVLEAAQRLDADWGVASEVWSATSFSELARDAREVERRNRLNPASSQETSHVSRCLPGTSPIIAATDYVRAYPQLIAAYVVAPFTALGTDGFGRSDTRAALRSFFEVDAGHVVVAALAALVTEGSVTQETVAEAIVKYAIEAAHEAPWSR
jgi:pyruvate dehydrogenase E1 component